MLNYDFNDLTERLKRILQSPTPILPAEKLHDFVKFYFDRRDFYLKVLEKARPPLYLQETKILRDRAFQIKKVFREVLPDVSFYYAVKSNNHPDVSRVMLEEEFGLDVSSGLELETALDMGAMDIVFSGPGKTSAELRIAAAHSDRVTVLLDSFGELSLLESVASEMDREVRCGVRLTVKPEGLWRKFGIPLEQLSDFWERSLKCKYLRLKGLQFHTSWNLSPDPQIEFLDQMGRFLSGMPDSFKTSLEFVDIGGGYWPPQGEWLHMAGTPRGRLLDALGCGDKDDGCHHWLSSAPIEDFARKIAAAIKRSLFVVVPCRICLEPGRWICNDAVQLLISVIDKKAPDLVITDAGTNAVGWERFETDYFPILNLTRPAMVERPCNILGSLCTPHDVWGFYYWGSEIKCGDILMIPTQGAYVYSLCQNFIKPLPRMITI